MVLLSIDPGVISLTIAGLAKNKEGVRTVSYQINILTTKYCHDHNIKSVKKLKEREIVYIMANEVLPCIDTLLTKVKSIDDTPLNLVIEQQNGRYVIKSSLVANSIIQHFITVYKIQPLSVAAQTVRAYYKIKGGTDAISSRNVKELVTSTFYSLISKEQFDKIASSNHHYDAYLQLMYFMAKYAPSLSLNYDI